jgi:hypothetical protein
MATVVELKMMFCRESRAMLVTKASAVVIGITLKNVITVTVITLIIAKSGQATAVGGGFSPQSQKEAIVTFCVTLFTFLLIVAVAVGLAYFLNNLEQLPAHLKKDYVAGLVLIPAWGWKDVIAGLMALVDYFGYLSKHVPWTYSLFAFLNAVLCASLQLVLERVASRFDKGGLVHSIVTALMSCFTLGVAFGVDTAVRVAVGEERFQQVRFVMIYVAVMVLLVPEFQRQVATRLDEETRARYPVALCKGLDFIAAAGGFIWGWAFKGLFDADIKDMAAQGLLWPGQLQVSILITLIGVSCGIAAFCLPIPEAYISLTSVVMGLNIGWTWMMTAGAMLAAKGGDDPSLADRWIQSLIVLAIVLSLGALVDYGLRVIESIVVCIVMEYRMAILKIRGLGKDVDLEETIAKPLRSAAAESDAASYGSADSVGKGGV